MAKFIVILLIALVFEAVGVVFLGGGLKQIGEPKQINAAEIIALIKRGATNKNILLGVFFEAIFFGFLLYMLSQKTSAWSGPLPRWDFSSLPSLRSSSSKKRFLDLAGQALV